MMPATPLAETPEERIARRVIRSLLDGAPCPAEVTPEHLGAWAENVRLLRDAQVSGGTDGVRRAFVVLARHDPTVMALLAGPNDPAQVPLTTAELYDSELPAPQQIVADLVPTGLTILAGRPKLGKSWLAQQIAAAVGTGGSVLGLQAARGRVLYLGLEDTCYRLRDRLHKQQVPRDAAISFHTEWAPLGQQGLTDLMLAAVQGYSLIVIDTLSRALGSADPMDATDMTQLLGELHRLALRNNLALLLVDHHRKLAANGNADPVDDILGSTAKAGIVDAALGLYRQRADSEAVLKITGRDLCERELALSWDAEHFNWICEGDAEEVACTARQQEILDALVTLGRAQLRDLADATGHERSSLFRRLQGLVTSGLVKRTRERGHVYYGLG
jgi:hypothetical protein